MIILERKLQTPSIQQKYLNEYFGGKATDRGNEGRYNFFGAEKGTIRISRMSRAIVPIGLQITVPRLEAKVDVVTHIQNLIQILFVWDIIGCQEGKTSFSIGFEFGNVVLTPGPMPNDERVRS